MIMFVGMQGVGLRIARTDPTYYLNRFINRRRKYAQSIEQRSDGPTDERTELLLVTDILGRI